VKNVDYPAICASSSSSTILGRGLSEEEACVRGTYVTGLSKADARALDVFEGDVSAAVIARL
jgi:hypothetical protein